MEKVVIVTGGAGYIGSHTIIELIQNTSFKVVSIDNYINSSSQTYDRIEKVTSKNIDYKELDLCDKKALFNPFKD